MLINNTMRFGTDIFTVATVSGGGGDDTQQGGGDDTQQGGGDDTQQGGGGGEPEEPVVEIVKTALLISNDKLDTTNVSKVNCFVIGGSEPEGSMRRFMFKIGSKYYKFNNGSLTTYTGGIDVDSVLENGNTAEELTTLSDITDLVGKQIQPIIALYGTDSANPTAKLQLKTTTTTLTKTKSETTIAYNLTHPEGGTPKITEITTDTTCTGGGSVAVKCQLQAADETWGAWINLADAANQEAIAVQFKFDYSVVNVGEDSAKVDSVAVKYIANEPVEIVSGDVAELYSVVQNFETDLRLCYLVVRHKKLIDSTIEAYCSYRPQPLHRERILLGKGTGSTTQYIMGVDGEGDAQIDHNTLEVFVNGVKTNEYDFNTETCELTINAAKNKPVTVSYDYGCGTEDWREMKVEFDQQPYGDGSYMTRWSYSLPDEEETAQCATVRIKLTRPTGKVTNLSIGKGTGMTQQIVLDHYALPDTITLKADSTAVDFNYDETTRILTFSATANKNVVISYTFKGEQHEVYSWAAGWSAAVDNSYLEGDD